MGKRGKEGKLELVVAEGESRSPAGPWQHQIVRESLDFREKNDGEG